MNFDTPITIALSKGRIYKQTLPLLAAAGIDGQYGVLLGVESEHRAGTHHDDCPDDPRVGAVHDLAEDEDRGADEDPRSEPHMGCKG